MNKIALVLLVFFLLTSCKSSEKFSGFSYDPPGVTNTSDRETTPQKRRVIGAGEPRVWISNEFEGARMNDFYAVNDSLFEVFIKPENAPINNSPWFGFKIWAEEPRNVTLRLTYHDARHRYQPKVYLEPTLFSENPADTSYYLPIETVFDSVNGTASFDLFVGEVPLIVTAQFPFTSRNFEQILKAPQIQNLATTKVIGYSHLNRPIYEVEVDQTDTEGEKGVLIILSRQHPPEIPGFLSSLAFMEELLSGSELAKKFRQYFIIKAYPFINPDGVDNGHWRHNNAGVDLNRDWENFNQPETRAVRDALLPLLNDPDKKVYYGIDFHSTNENIFYPIEESVVTFPDNITQKWYELIVESNAEIFVNYEEFDTSSPIAKNWIYKTFGADAVTYEVNDKLTISDIEILSQSSAQHLMSLLLDAYIKNNY